MANSRDPLQWLRLMDERGNVGFVCEQHRSKPGGYVGRAPEEFLGRAVKLCFPSLGGATENMWVRVEKLGDAELGVQLVGILHNEPVRALDPSMGDLHHGDGIGFDVAEIADVNPPFAEETPGPKPPTLNSSPEHGPSLR